MCGRYRRRSDKQRIAEAFEVGMGLEDLYVESSDDIAPGSMQPVVYLHSSGERGREPHSTRPRLAAISASRHEKRTCLLIC
jgi:putative SOS response-associated peptidase YedK